MYVHVRVKAKAKSETVEEIGGNRIVISVKEPAEDNRANARVLELVSEYYGMPRSSVKIIKGHHRPQKLIQLLNSSRV